MGRALRAASFRRRRTSALRAVCVASTAAARCIHAAGGARHALRRTAARRTARLRVALTLAVRTLRRRTSALTAHGKSALHLCAKSRSEAAAPLLGFLIEQTPADARVCRYAQQSPLARRARAFARRTARAAGRAVQAVTSVGVTGSCWVGVVVVMFAEVTIVVEVAADAVD